MSWRVDQRAMERRKASRLPAWQRVKDRSQIDRPGEGGEVYSGAFSRMSMVVRGSS